MTPRNFDNDEQFLAYLATVNPDCNDMPEAWDYAAETNKARRLYLRLEAEFGPEIALEYGIQDASYHAEIFIPPSSQVRLSKFDHLATITEAGEPLAPAVIARVAQILEECSYTDVPFRLFGVPFGKRERFNDDLFNQLFDYL